MCAGGKQGFTWLGPYRIVKSLGRGLYRIVSVDDSSKIILRVHGVHLKQYRTPKVDSENEIIDGDVDDQDSREVDGYSNEATFRDSRGCDGDSREVDGDSNEATFRDSRGCDGDSREVDGYSNEATFRDSRGCDGDSREVDGDSNEATFRDSRGCDGDSRDAADGGSEVVEGDSSEAVLRESGVTGANCGREIKGKELSMSTVELNLPHACIRSPSVEVGNEDYLNWIYYSPVCKEWQKNICLILGIKFHSGNRDHGLKPSLIAVSQAPETTGRIKGDGNCFFRAIAQIVTGDQDDHNEMRLIVTTYMMNNRNLPKLSGIFGKRTKMQNSKV